MTAVEINDVHVSFGSVEVLSGISLQVEAGEWLSIIGPNGAGKSTLLRAIAGAVDISGSVLIGGSSTADLKPKERALRVSWVPQSPVIPAGMAVFDYVLLGRTPHLGLFAHESSRDIEIVEQVIADLDLESLAGRSVDTLSGGEQQRAAIARAVAQQAPLMLLDEPTSALDLGHQQEVLDVLDRLRTEHGQTMISTMHDLTLAGQCATRLVLVDRGTIVASGSAVDVLTEANIAAHYRARVQVLHRDGAVVVVPSAGNVPAL